MIKILDFEPGIYILCALIFFILPIPSIVVEVMLIINITLTFIWLFYALFVKEVLNMYFFPSLLILNTFFRASLNASSTRLILSTGNPGNLIATIGYFVCGDNIVLGVTILIVAFILQFMVVNKGSRQIAEISARFVLDVMPGRQMAIDADLNTGTITDEEAKRRRNMMLKEANFYRVVAEHTKYIKWDAIAGFIITMVNLIGGVACGVIYLKMDLMDALQKFGVLAIGEGLAFLISALTITISIGVLVTKGQTCHRDGSSGTIGVDNIGRRFLWFM